MSNLISVPLPINIALKETDLYSPYKDYEFPVQKIKYFKNVFVAFSGFCLNKKGLIRECHHDYPVQHEYYLNEASRYYYDAMDKPDNLIELDNDIVYLAIHHPWFNYYHWICESIFRIWLIRKKLDCFTLILPDYYKSADFITGSLEPFRINEIYLIPNGKSLLVKNLCIPQIKPVCDSYNGLHLRQVRSFYIQYVKNRQLENAVKIERMYISRKLAGRRRVINAGEINNILKKCGFTNFYPEEHSFLEQVAIFSGVKYLVAEHGSGLTNMLFMGKHSSVLELHKNNTNELTHPSFLFWYMSEALEINYYHQSCKTYGKEDYFEGDYVVEPKLFEKNLVFMLKGDL